MQKTAELKNTIATTPPLYNDIAFLRSATLSACKNYEFGTQNANHGEFWQQAKSLRTKLGKQGFVLRHKYEFNCHLKCILKLFEGIKWHLNSLLKLFGRFNCHLKPLPKPFGHFKRDLKGILKAFGRFKCHLKPLPKPFGRFNCHLKPLRNPFGHFKCHLKSFLKPLGGLYEGNPVDFLG